MNSFGAKTLNDAIELLSMMGGGGGDGDQQSFSQLASTNQTSDQGSRDSTRVNQKASNSPSIHNEKAENNQRASASSATNQITAASISTANQTQSASKLATNESSYNLKPLFLSDGVTEEFLDLFSNAECESAADHLIVVIHALVTETGFVIKVSE